MKFCPSSLSLNRVDENFIQNLKKYIDKEAKSKSGRALSQNSKYTYFNKFKACIRSAQEEGLINRNVLKNIKGFKQGESQREYLTMDKVQLISNTESRYPILKAAFLFSCLSGLRWSDIYIMKLHDFHKEYLKKVTYDFDF